jgi:hypothetical protein
MELELMPTSHKGKGLTTWPGVVGRYGPCFDCCCGTSNGAHPVARPYIEGGYWLMFSKVSQNHLILFEK